MSDEERSIKHAIQELIKKLEQLQNDVNLKQNDMEVTSFDHFTEIRRQIDIQREELKKKIDDIALKLIDQTNERENVYKLKLKESISVVVDADIAQFNQIWTREFRNPVLLVDQVKSSLQVAHERNVTEFAASICEFESVGQKIKSLAFEPAQEFQELDFGSLRLTKNPLIASISARGIKIWNLDTDECTATLQEHGGYIKCIDNIDVNRFATGSADNTIRIWDAKSFVCLKTLMCHQNGVYCLRSLPGNRLASSSNDGDIKVWDIESGECLQTMQNPRESIRDIVCMPNGNLVTISEEESAIKVWDLVRGECIRTLVGHTRQVFDIVLLSNGELASHADDERLKIWNVETGECSRTLLAFGFGRFFQLESGQLVSSPVSETIKFWDLTEDRLDETRTLYGHTDCVNVIRESSQNNLLASSSYDGTIKTWNLKTGKCVNTIREDHGRNFIFIWIFNFSTFLLLLFLLDLKFFVFICLFWFK